MDRRYISPGQPRKKKRRAACYPKSRSHRTSIAIHPQQPNGPVHQIKFSAVTGTHVWKILKWTLRARRSITSFNNCSRFAAFIDQQRHAHTKKKKRKRKEMKICAQCYLLCFFVFCSHSRTQACTFTHGRSVSRTTYIFINNTYKNHVLFRLMLRCTS